MQAVLRRTQLEVGSVDHHGTSLSGCTSTASSSLFLFLFPPCVILLVVDAAMRFSQRRTNVLADVSPSDEEVKKMNTRARQVIYDLEQLGKRLKLEEQRVIEKERILQKQRNFAIHRERMLSIRKLELGAPAPATPIRRDRKERVGRAFTSFCERLLLQNKIWKQRREIKALQDSLNATKSANSSSAFQAFCERLVLTNAIWKLQRDVDRLTAETEKVRRSRVLAVTRAAKQMVLDVRKERLIEEFVKDLLEEVAECRATVKELRAGHEREIQEMAQDFRKERLQLLRQVEDLKLAQEARLLEQEISNNLDSELIERLTLSEQQVASLTERLEAVCEQGVSQDDPDMSDTDLEVMSNMSSTTCVGSAGNLSPNRKTIFGDDDTIKRRNLQRRRSNLVPLKLQRAEDHLPRSSGSPLRKIDPAPYAGFSFNPLFFGLPDEVNVSTKVKRVSLSLKVAPSPSIVDPDCTPTNTKPCASVTSLQSPPQKRAWRV